MKNSYISHMALLLVLGACGSGSSKVDPDGAVSPDGGTSSDADICAVDTAPVLTSSTADVGFPVGATTTSITLSFDQEVDVSAEAVSIDGGATLVVTPGLPATANQFTVEASGLVDGSDYTLAVSAAGVANACGTALPSDAAIAIVSGCASDVTGPSIISPLDTLVIEGGATTASYTLEFDEVVNLAAGAITTDGSATLAVTPALPAAASSFEIALSNVSDADSFNLSIAAASTSDRCGNALASDVTLATEGACFVLVDPSFTSVSGTRQFLNETYTHTFSFDEPVTIAAGGISVDNAGIATVTPALPATATSFEVVLTNLVDTDYTVTAASQMITDACGGTPAADQTLELLTCVGDLNPPQLTSDNVVLSCGPGGLSYELSFGEEVSLPTGALTVAGGATIASIAPALPATADSFGVELTDINGANTLSVAVGVSDVCGNLSAEVYDVSIDVGEINGSVIADFTGAIVEQVIPHCSTLLIEVSGEEGGSNSGSSDPAGLGARMAGDFSASSTRQFQVLVGEHRTTNGGGGGSFVASRVNEPLIIAGGGGGSGSGPGAWSPGSAETSGQSCTDGGGVGGVDGNGGTAAAAFFQSGAAGGFFTDGADGTTNSAGGSAFINGGAGGTSNGAGGFGGGGSGSGNVVGGGGGGYSGGSSCHNPSGVGRVGAGGGSLNTGTNQTNESGVHSGNGVITFTWTQ